LSSCHASIERRSTVKTSSDKLLAPPPSASRPPNARSRRKRSPWTRPTRQPRGLARATRGQGRRRSHRGCRGRRDPTTTRSSPSGAAGKPRTPCAPSTSACPWTWRVACAPMPPRGVGGVPRSVATSAPSCARSWAIHPAAPRSRPGTPPTPRSSRAASRSPKRRCARSPRRRGTTRLDGATTRTRSPRSTRRGHERGASGA